MEPFRALTLLATAGVISLVGAGAGGFYAGYIAGKKAFELATGPVVNVGGGTGGGGAVSLKPILEDIRSLSKQVETLAAASKPSSDSAENAKAVTDEIRALSKQIDAIKARPSGESSGGQTTASAADYSEELSEIKEQIKALNTKFERQEPKAPKALVDEIRALSASVQAQEPNTRRVIADELHSAVAALQNSEPRAPKALLDEVKNISATLSRPQPSVVDQIKVLSAQIQALGDRAGGSNSERGKGDPSMGADIIQMKQLLVAASEQFGKCQTQLASLSAAGFQQPAQQLNAATNAVTVSQSARPEPAVVFYDNVMLRKDQEKQYDEIGVKLSLQSVTPRQVRLAVNRQGFGLAFGERKVFRSQDVECELNLMETNLNDSQARVSISCKR